MTKIRIATRNSPLALWQAHHVSDRLRAAHPGLLVELVEMSTAGDRFLQSPLSQIGGKGLFVKEIEQALIDGRADLAVHSLKDMTSQMPEGLMLAAVPEREDPRDVFAGAHPGSMLAQLPRGAKVGTSSLRRSCQLLEKRPDLEVVSVRGNVQTRLRKIEELGLSGVLLALAGLKRLGLDGRITEVLEPEVSLPAVGQGVLALQCREADARMRGLLSPLDHADTRVAVAAERAFMARLEGGCSVPLAGYATLSGGQVRLRGLIGRPDGTKVVRGERTGPLAEAATLGRELAEALLVEGGEEILHAYARKPLIPDS